MLRTRPLVLSEVRRLVSETKELLRRAMEAVSNNDMDLAEKLASEAIKRLDEASRMLSMIELSVSRRGDSDGAR